MIKELPQPQMIWNREVLANYGLTYMILGNEVKGKELIADAVNQNQEFWDYYSKKFPDENIYTHRELNNCYRTASNILNILKNYGFTELETKYSKVLKPMTAQPR